MIIGTAGHIDHGKTTLVRALTGVDTDRLKEEKARGISIELGYAYTPLSNGGILGIIDVPGHERFVHTMAAGACGIDFALLAVAADDGVMPQTREHVAILHLLDIRHGAVAVTKVDRVDADRVTAVHAEIAALLAATPLAGAPMFDTNATAAGDAGIAALDRHLRAAAVGWQARRDDGLFRLAVDRVFTLAGHGTVVTGTVFAGRVDVGCTLVLAPADMPVRVRSIHTQNRPAQAGHAGERCALNLAGIERERIARGDWIVDSRISAASPRLDTEFTLLADVAAPLTHWAQLHIHLGTAHRLARVALLDGEILAPGQTARVQLVFDTPVCALPGDRFIARNAQATQTLGGGRVLDPFGPSAKRRSAERRAWLDALTALLDGKGLAALLRAAPLGIARATAMHLCGLPAERLPLPPDTLTIEHGADATLILTEHWQALADKTVAALRANHERAPDEHGLGRASLRRIAAPLLSDSMWQVLIDTLLRDARIQRSGSWLHLPDHVQTLSDAEHALAAALLPYSLAGRFDPPWVRELARALGAEEETVRRTMRKLARQGELYQVVRDLFYHPEAVKELARLIASLAAQHGGPVSAAAFRDATGLGRKRAIQVFEFFDRIGYTRFHREAHWIRPDNPLHELP